MVDSARWKPRWPSQPWSPSWCSASPASPPSRCRCDVSTPHGRRRGWRHAVILRRPRLPPVSPRRGRRRMCALMATLSSPGSAAVQSYCPGCSSSRKPSRLLSLVSDDAGAATVLAAVLVAALVTTTLGGIWLGAVEVARHRAQAVADLAALAAAGRLTLGPDVACRQADQLAASMQAAVRGCAVEQLDVVVTVGVRTGGRISVEARAAARAGPSGSG